MTETQLGIGFPQFPHGLPPASWFAERARQSEELGFDSLWHGERLLTPFPMLDPIPVLAHLAAVTSRIRLGSNVILLPLHQPVLIAKAAVSLDHLSAGRFILGVAPGGDFPHEFESCGVPHKERGGRTAESIVLLRRLWREPVVDHEGRYYRVRSGTILPKPVQDGGPPVWVGGRGDWAIRCAAELGDAWCPSFMPASRFRQSWQRLCQLAHAAGRDAATITPAVHLFFYIARSFDAAWPVAASCLGLSYQRSYDAEWLAKFCAVGSADDCRQALLALMDAGVRHFVLTPACSADGIPEQLDEAASALLPLRGM